VPLWRSRGEAFDDLVLDAVEELEDRWSEELADVEFAVEDVPDLADARTDFAADVVADRGVPLGRLHREGLDGVRKPVIVVYRRPVEVRTAHREDRADLVFAVVVELVAELLGRDAEDISPT
jgi:predicted Zn-dependent protease with MMP-like domain